ncbi:hypothetical protein HY639_00345 [Candidatus Woesearchaeota archaeon]|nr:hypothetical protein [Candidatus Woesearchaeota archaeon]
MLQQLKTFRDLSYKHLLLEQDVKPFLIFVSFLITFFISRAIVYIFPTVNLIVFEYHIHHFYYGLILLIVSNYVALLTHQERARRFCAVLYGIGLGLVTDEVGILLTCGTAGRLCDPYAIYWSRLSFDIVIYIGLLFGVWLFLPPVWRRMWHWYGGAS